ncbi:sigma-70 family RNA polymerase sigma factor [Leptobacterium flavescens]|uniref:Sigma-70 family RNA polymerase sigma factor n=1 Tax=Leptobacterium flavescens TaxID=472055 RepID=A0A6P0UT96_9FLAO|nr:RNA polymerase sigma factor [Leptobacterium flavescens]NER13626.1 sigma-70 family RNA polymerase sigma factor [Leptobacterium flavescens]
MNKKEDKLIQEFLKDRSSSNFLNLYNLYNGSLMRLAMYFTRNKRELAEDILQESWITAVKKLDTFKGTSSFKTWMTGILVNKYRESNRKFKEEVRLEVIHQQEQYHPSDNLAIDLKNAIFQLPDGYREILTLYDIEGYKHKEIAAALRISEGTSKSQLFQARKSMRALLEGYKKNKQWKS